MAADPSVSPADTIRWHTQTLAGGGDVPPEERGDCVRACITSVLGLPLSAMENVHGDGWWDRLRIQTQLHGYDLAEIDTQYEPPMEAYWIATLPSLNLGPQSDGSQAEHCVVARGYTLIHDPALGEKYDDEKWTAAWGADKVTAGWVLVPCDPAALLAVGERDKAEIAELRGALDEARETLWDFDKTLVAELSIEDWKHRLFVQRVKLDSLADSFTAVSAVVGERDRQHIERLTEALELIAAPRHIGSRDSFKEIARAVLADKEDAGNG